MAWRPNEYVIEGELDNTQPGRVTGWILFAGLKDKVTFDLQGDFHRDIRGARSILLETPMKGRSRKAQNGISRDYPSNRPA
jgi:hypothetical protein